MLDWLSSLWDKFAQMILSALPISPFRGVVKSLGDLPYLHWLNWFIPVGKILDLCTLWLAAILIFYLYSVIARWVKVIGD